MTEEEKHAAELQELDSVSHRPFDDPDSILTSRFKGREMGTIHDGIGGEYPQYDGSLVYPEAIRKKALVIYVQRVQQRIRQSVEYIREGWLVASGDSTEVRGQIEELKAVLSEVYEDLARLSGSN